MKKFFAAAFVFGLFATVGCGPEAKKETKKPDAKAPAGKVEDKKPEAPKAEEKKPEAPKAEEKKPEAPKK